MKRHCPFLQALKVCCYMTKLRRLQCSVIKSLTVSDWQSVTMIVRWLNPCAASWQQRSDSEKYRQETTLIQSAYHYIGELYLCHAFYQLLASSYAQVRTDRRANAFMRWKDAMAFKFSLRFLYTISYRKRQVQDKTLVSLPVASNFITYHRILLLTMQCTWALRSIV